MTTPSNLDARIRAAVSELVGAAPPAPGFPDAQARVRAQKAAALKARRHRGGVVLVAAAIVAVFFVPLPHLSLFNRLGRNPSATTVPVSGSSCIGMVVPASALSTISFTNATDGLGVFSRSTRCGARLASTSDGGEIWRLSGAPFPAPTTDFSQDATPTITFATGRVGWVNGGGVLVVTRDRGATWSVVRLGGFVAAISRSGYSLWAFVAPCMASPRSCRYRVEATTFDERTWHEVALLPAAMGNWTPLVVTRLNGERALVAIGQMGSASTFLTTDGGARWSSVKACAPSGFIPVSFATTSPRDVWAMCLGGAGMGSSLKSLVRSSDGGQTWSLVALDRNFDPGTLLPIPAEDGEILAVSSTGLLWMATVNFLTGSFDGGKRWFTVAGTDLDGGGAFASFAFVNSTHGWLLAPGSGLWRTTNDKKWRSVTQILFTHPAARCASVIPGWTLSAITFFNANDGLGIWSRNSRCGDRLVSTEDGGESWKVVGSELPAPGSSYGQMIFSTPRFGWVFNGNTVYVTRDGGVSWSRVRLGGWVVAISAAGSSLWAFVSPCNSAVNTCAYPYRLRLEATTFRSRSWHEVGLLPEVAGASISVARLSPSRAVIVETGLRGRTQVSLTTDGGAQWTAVRQPCGSLEPNLGPVIATGNSELFATCSGMASMEPSPQALFRSDDGGKTWAAVGTDRGVGAPSIENPIPFALAGRLAGPSSKELWMVDVNSFHGSTDGGRAWFLVPSINFEGGGPSASFCFVSDADGWMLDPVVGLWRTTNGTSWTALSLDRPAYKS